MIKLKVCLDGKEVVTTFQEEKLALLYRDYHIRFGQWAKHFRWVREDLATDTEKALVFDEKNEFVDGVVYKFLFCGMDISIELEEVAAKSVKNCWVEFRQARNELLKNTDWTQLGDTPLSSELKKQYRDYRNYLRVLPDLHNDTTIVTAKICSFVEWRNGER